MSGADLLTDGFHRVQEVVHATVDGLDIDQLAYRIDDSANSIAWLIWHLTRVQDDHIAAAAGSEQVWLSDGWVGRFALPFDDHATGYAQSADDVGQVRAEPGELLAYHDAVHDRTVAYLDGLSDADLEQVVDADWDPPVTLSVRLVSVFSDDLQHAGQAAYVRGLLQRR
ncbi:MAG: mycothiol transferase [Jatrophihabitans sp.]